MATLTLLLICTWSILVQSSDDLPRASIITGAFNCRPYRVFVGQQYVRFTCQATSSDAERVTSYLWTFRGAPISLATGRVLNLSPITRNSGGSYTCIGRHVTDTSSPVIVDAQYGPTVQAIRSVSVTEFQNLNVACSVESNPVATVKWTRKNNAQFTPQTESTLAIANIQRSQAGTYVCTATNTLRPCGRTSVVRSDSVEVTVDVQYGPTVQAIRSVSVTEFQNLNVACSVESNPVATVKWTRKNNAQFTPQTGSTLTIANIQRSQAGTYVCTATNTLRPCGRTSVVRSDSVEVTMDVQYKPKIRTLSVNHATNQVTVSEGDRITLRCEVDSNPLSTLKLLFGRKELTTTFKSLTVEYTWAADCKHTGRYSCEAENSVDDPARGYLELFVRCAPRPDEMSPLHRKYVSSHGGNVILSITILSYPRPTIIWMRPEGYYPNNLSSLSGETSTSALTVASTLNLQDLQEDDFGLYQVHANNAVGQRVETLILVSQGPPLAPTDVTVHATDSSSLNIAWKQEFNGGSVQIFTVEYSKDKRHWAEAGSYEETGRGKYHHVVLNDLDSDTTYYVRIITRNIYGDSIHTVSVEGRTESHLKDPAVIAGISIGVVLLIGNAVIIVLSRKSLTCFEETKNEGASHTGAMQNTQDASIYSGLQDNECDKQIYTGLKSFEKSPTECNSEYQGLQMRSTQVYEDLNISSIKTPTEPNAGDLHVYEN